jgi:inhibitor of KinA
LTPASRAASLNITPAGDSGLLLRLGDDISPGTFDRVMAALSALDAPAGWPAGWLDVMPGYASLLVVFDPVVTSHDEVRATLAQAVLDSTAAARPPGRLVEIPVRYHPNVAPDLEELLAQKQLSLAELVARHTAPVYLCHMLGFRPGFPFLGGLDPRLATPRLATPRTAVPAGSVAIGGRQAGIYPSNSPGGWRIIGHTPLRLFDPARVEPFLIQPGDRVTFHPVD